MLAGLVGAESTLMMSGCATRSSGGNSSSSLTTDSRVEPSVGSEAPVSLAATPARGVEVPTRPFGRTGVEISMLTLGGYFDAIENASLLDRAFALGVRSWETTLQWGGKGYGAYF